jgi:CHAT domain-containing protein
MKNATEIDFFTHGVLNSYSDASYLLLASEQGRSELRVSRVRTTRLSGAPFVVLAACHAAHTAYALHEPLSLPAAFIEAGARGVLAATVEILDLEAGAFFDAVRERMRSGVDPAVALRDERMRWLAEGRGGSWIHSVLLFD